MEVFVLFVSWCINAECMVADVKETTEGVFRSHADCKARGEFLVKDKIRPADLSASNEMYYCEIWTVTPRGAPTSRKGPADFLEHIPR